jgi:cell division protein FtsB
VPRSIRTIDDAMAKIRERLAMGDTLRDEFEKLRRENEALRQRLEKLESAGSSGK